jgi:phenylpyruvate tautomerase PptA (4-oxalocrotonate tautomerase family)
MPLIRLDVPESLSPQSRRLAVDVVYDALRAELSVPEDDRFAVVSAHDATGLQIDQTYLDIDRSQNALIVQITLNAGRDAALKRAFYAAVAAGLRDRVGVRPEDVFISLVEVTPENWSFGNGLAQYALAET